MALVKLRDVSVQFRIYDSRRPQLVRAKAAAAGGDEWLKSTSGRISGHGNRVSIHALNGVNLTIEHGSRIGLVGRNGAGKSTLLYVIAGIYVPTQGSVMVEGTRASLLGGTLGIDNDLTGRENIELRGLYLGMSKAEIRDCMDEVIAFTGLGGFVDMPLRTYSAGMRARLAFAISTAIRADILLLDEGLGVGDASFIDKANARLDELAAAAGIVLVASHSDPLLRQLCTTAILMDGGRIVAMGDLDEILERYAAEGGTLRKHHARGRT